MSYNITTNKFEVSDLVLKLQREKKSANELQERRHEAWDETYELYRNRVRTNRLTQRQAVNIPLMKETIKTILASIDEEPLIEWSELAGDEQKEIIYQEVWDDRAREDKFALLDIVDKKNVLLYGIGTRKLNLVENGVTLDILDPYDVVFDPLMEPGNVESARFIINQNVFKSVREILADERYTSEGKEDIKIWADSPPGIIQGEDNKKRWEEKLERLRSMGVDSSEFPLFSGGETIVNLTEQFHEIWDTKKKKFVRYVSVYAEDTILLMHEPLYDLIGVEFWPFVVWSEDVETQDIYPDSVGDIVRTPNKILNVWLSQMVENRSLKNFQMHWFSPVQGYQPQTFTPGPGVMLPAPPSEDINKVIKPVEISGLDDTLTAIAAITQIVERATGATAIQKGEPEGGKQTLGEIEILVGKALERTTSMSKFYKIAWYETAYKWDKMMHANKPKFLSLYKKSQSGKIYQKRVYAGDWASDVGYKPVVRSSSEREQESVKSLQKFDILLQRFPNNTALRRISQKRMIEIVDITPEEYKQIEEEEKKIAAAMQLQASQGAGTEPEMGNIPQLLGELTN